MVEKASASATKRFFVKYLTRDISIEDAILDLIDNSIDAFIRSEEPQILNDPSQILGSDKTGIEAKSTSEVRLNFKSDRIVIEDNCGGIPLDAAKLSVFQFGNEDEGSDESTLSVFGVGLKRAIFKLGRTAEITSLTEHDYFQVTVDTESWLHDSDPKWSFPIDLISARPSEAKPGTKIEIWNLTDAAKAKINILAEELPKLVATTYPFFLDRYVRVLINDNVVAPEKVLIAESDQLKASVKSFEEDGVKVTVIAGLARRRKDEIWRDEKAGWYVLCNGRAVLSADKTKATGWAEVLPRYQPKFRGFVGIVFFYSRYVERLPWTTAKRGVDKDSLVYQHALTEMIALARPVIKFLDGLYKVDEFEVDEDRKIVEEMEKVDVSEVAQRSESLFMAPQRLKAKSIETKVQYYATHTEIDKAKTAFRAKGERNLSASRVGRLSLEYFLKNECD